jgi:electron transport complex protein RnfG
MFVVRLGLILMLIAALASGGLALLNTQTAPVIAENKAREQAQARAEVMRSLGVDTFKADTTEDGKPFWRAYDERGHHAGYVTVARGKGYSSTIETVAGFDRELNVAGLKITFQQETPGLGTKAEEVNKGEKTPWFLKQFEGRDATDLAVKQDRGEIDAITGATITSRAIANSIKEDAHDLIDVAQADEEVEQAPADTMMTADTASAEDGEENQ